jgi:tripartite-type tricarboxylate transporter receptor subunit TctC
MLDLGLVAYLVRRISILFAIAVTSITSLNAETFPANKVIRIVAPTSPGAPPDVIARIVANELANNEGWRVIVDNRPGALQTIAMMDVLKQTADGLSIFPMSLGAIATPTLLPDKGIRLETDFAPVVKIATGYTVLVVNPSVQAKSLSELIAVLKAEPDKFSYSSAAFGTPAHLLGELFKLQTGVRAALIPYPQGQQRLADLLNGTTHFSFYNTPAVVDLVAAGKLRALAVTAPKRIPVLRDVPTVVEEGYPNLVMEDWIGLVVKNGSPNEAIERLNAAVNRVLAKQTVQNSLASLGYEPAGGPVGELGDLIRTQVAYWGSVVKDSGIKMSQ